MSNTSELTLEKLIQKRRNLIEAHRENDFTEGIHALLTDLYPDTAHFIYELLQNAEDMNATAVRFILDESSIHFEHNGTKRAFNIADIDAITSIGHNHQKKDDPTSIGKFGVGFKAVFAYTSTPIIHSGDYHFKITDYFVPDVYGVPKLNTIDSNGTAWTKFSFPFNNPKKTPATAFCECSDGLKALDASAVLFLQNIKRIEYMLPSGGIGSVELVDDGNHHVTVTYKKPDEPTEHKSRWLRFDRMVDMTDDQENLKNLSIAIAFSLKCNAKQKEYISPVIGGGRTFIYFPAEKEHSGLRFHINAPFASTVARDSVRDCQDNVKLIRAISQLISDSLPEIKSQGLMNHSFFEVLPNNKDNLSKFYHCILDRIYAAFQRNDYLPTRNGGYTSAKNALSGPQAISNLLKEADMCELFNIEKTWITNAAQRNSDADSFIQSLGIQTFTFKDFAEMFGTTFRSKSEQFLRERSNGWLKRFYALCADACEHLDYYFKYAFVRNMKYSQVIRSTKGKMYQSSDIYILPVNETLITKTTPIVEQAFVLSSEKNDKVCNKIRSFFYDELEIRNYGPKIEVERLLRKYDERFKLDDQYFKDLIVFAKYRHEHDDIDFSVNAIFLYLNNSNNHLYIEKASELFLGKAYGNSDGEILASACGKYCIWNGYAEHYNEKELELFIRFLSSCGILKNLSIEKRPVSLNPLYITNLYSYARKHTNRGSDSDYTIPNLEKLLKEQSISISKHIWETLERYGKSAGYNKYIKACYSPNGSVTPKTCDSSLIYYLKNYAWVPDKQGRLCKPEDIMISELHNDFVYDTHNLLLTALGIGSAVAKQNQKQKELEQEAKKVGMHLIPDDDFKEYQQWKARQEASKNTDPLSVEELLNKQKKRSVLNVNAGDNFSTDGAVNNVARRERNIEATFHNATQMEPAHRKLFGKIEESTKEERNLLRNWYQGYCQMCNTVIIRHDQKPHFVAMNIINTQHLSNAIRQTTNLAWNSLCLCPNCAAKYRVCSRDLNGLYKQIMQTEVIEGDPERIVLSIELDGKRQDIRYIPKHFLALKKVMQLIDDATKE